MTPKEFTFDAAYQPQVRAKRGTREIMLDVIIALLPALPQEAGAEAHYC